MPERLRREPVTVSVCRPSHYVAGILSSLSQFLESESAKGLQSAARQEIAGVSIRAASGPCRHAVLREPTELVRVQGIVSDIAQRFCKMSAELLETLRKTESSLKRIRQSRATEASAAGGPSDIDKISMQLFLDVQVLSVTYTRGLLGCACRYPFFECIRVW